MLTVPTKCLHVTCSPPAPPPVPGRRFWFLRPPGGSPRQTHYPGRPGSEPAAYHSLCASVSESKGMRCGEDKSEGGKRVLSQWVGLSISVSAYV